MNPVVNTISNIIQIDGNDSLVPDISCEEISVGESFLFESPRPCTPDPMCCPQNPGSKKSKTAQSLPKIMVANHRSIFPKFNHLIDELIECDVQVGIHSEIWEDNENLEHKNKIEEALELHGIVYISNPRPKRRGGGAAITLSDQKNRFTLTKLPIHVPPDLEVCWGLVKTSSPQPIKEIIIYSFYCPLAVKERLTWLSTSAPTTTASGQLTLTVPSSVKEIRMTSISRTS